MVAASGRRLLEKQPRGSAEIAKLLQARWPERDARALGYAVQYLLPIVQLPPRGVWGASGPVTWATAEAWLGLPLKDPAPLDKLVLRYLAAFGPASVMDIRSWSGITGLREVTDRLGGGCGCSRPQRETNCSTFRMRQGQIQRRLRRRASFRSTTCCSVMPTARGSFLRGRQMVLSSREACSSGRSSSTGFLWGVGKSRSSATGATLIIDHFVRLRKQDRTALTRRTGAPQLCGPGRVARSAISDLS